MGSPYGIGWEGNTGSHQWVLSVGRWAAHSLRVRHCITIISRREGPDRFIRDLSADPVECADMHRTETTRSPRHWGGGFDFENVMEMAEL